MPAPLLTALLALSLATSAASRQGAVATSHPLASEVGAAVLRDGGNAADAAVAAALALGVVEPFSSGIGGGGFALVYLARERKVHVLDFREVAPAAATASMFLVDGKPEPGRSRDGGLAVAVPGAVKGYAELARRFGSRPLARLTAPAERLAREGFRVGERYGQLARERRDCLAADAAARVELLARDPAGGVAAPAPGALLVRRDLADTLHAIGESGGEAFYSGPLAERIARAVRERGGVLTAADLAAFRVRERQPLEGTYRGHRVVSMPLPSAGGAILIALLQALEAEAPRAGGYRPERFLHAMIEVEQRLFARRADALADPAFAPGAEAAVRELVAPAYAARLRAAVKERAAPGGGPAREGHTHHLSVVDREGNAVALTTTVNLPFGSCVVVPGTGVLLNDEMDDFEAAAKAPNAYGLAGRGLNRPAPGKIPLSSMAPTLLLDRDRRLELVVGSPGGSTIPTTVAQVISHVVDDQMPLDAALAAPRLHAQGAEGVWVEPDGLEAATARALEARGHRLVVKERPWGNAQAVELDAASGLARAASDPRGEGAPAVP
ncbi:MAG TPA: gamma-glutamyltransferase [Anaeromyxobacteraceae bacterium]|nr:gamma-glutamyltransferase [Anaeromyxobacteraceae bacterium]